jgi:lipid II:glycine glycyltransferase (peptidoglycan interpeptide bridge formation enzyme)
MRTFHVDLRPSIEDLRKNLHRSWRRSLAFAEKQGLILEEAKDQEHYDLILKIYSQMKSRKKFFGNMQLDMLEVHKDLPGELKLKIMLCKERDEVVSVLGWSNLGTVCYPLIGATGDRGLYAKASFLLWWEMVLDAKAHHAAYCDTATVHEKRNPGGHFFKQGLAGKDALESRYIGRFDAHRNFLTYGFLRTALGLREKVVNAARRIKIQSRSDRPRDNS